MLEKNEKIYLIILVISMIFLIFTILYFTNNCPNYEIYSNKNNKPIIVYKIN